MIDEKILMEVLDGLYLTEDNYSNDCYLRDDVLKAIEKIKSGDYKKEKICLNCQRKEDCKYEHTCKTKNPLLLSNKDYFKEEK